MTSIAIAFLKKTKFDKSGKATDYTVCRLTDLDVDARKWDIRVYGDAQTALNAERLRYVRADIIAKFGGSLRTAWISDAQTLRDLSRRSRDSAMRSARSEAIRNTVRGDFVQIARGANRAVVAHLRAIRSLTGMQS